MTGRKQEIENFLSSCTKEEKEFIFKSLRSEIPIHPLETKLMTQAEIILEAIYRDQKGLTFRMLRGVIAEAAFGIEVISKLKNWKDVTPDGDLSYDIRLTDNVAPVTVQVKLQRSIEFRPMMADEAYKRFSPNMYVVETQKTRAGKDSSGNDTRPYKFGEFDIIAVAMQPSTSKWDSFMYTVSSWLLPDPRDTSKILKFQPVAMKPNDDWTDNFEECVKRLREGAKKVIAS